jgi:hypothetical protein
MTSPVAIDRVYGHKVASGAPGYRNLVEREPHGTHAMAG